MKKNIAFLFGLILCHLANAQGGYTFSKKIFGYTLDTITVMTNDADSTMYIDDLLRKIYKPDDSVRDIDIAFGYYGFVLLPDYNPDKYIGLELQVMQANDIFNFKLAKKLADSLTTEYPTGLMGHVELSYAYNRLQDTLKAYQHRVIYERLCDVILKSGDGANYDSAYIVAGLKDIEVLTQIKHWQIKKRKTKKKKGHTYEVVTVFDKLQERDIYFDITLLQEFRR